jgi:hypothetical protein
MIIYMKFAPEHEISMSCSTLLLTPAAPEEEVEPMDLAI